MSAPRITDAVLGAMARDRAHMSIRSITRRLAEAGLRVQVWRKATREQVHQKWIERAVMILPIQTALKGERDWCMVWLDPDNTTIRNFAHRDLCLMFWKPHGIAIICSDK